jgi:excisionase family DNA binding protein
VLLTTGKAAEVIGCSRQHVVDLCNAGTLPHQLTPVHRRIRREDAEALARRRTARRPQLRREELRSLWLNRAIAGKLATDPEPVLQIARDNLARFTEIHRGGTVEHWLQAWRAILGAGPEAVMDTLTSTDPHAIELRQNSPFPGVLSDDERHAVLASFKRYWRQQQAQ